MRTHDLRSRSTSHMTRHMRTRARRCAVVDSWWRSVSRRRRAAGRLRALAPETRAALRTLAVTHMQSLGAHSPTRAMVEREMLRHFVALAPGLPAGAEREPRLRRAVQQALGA